MAFTYDGQLTLLSLPREIFIKIADHLSSREYVVSLGRCCHDTQDAIGPYLRRSRRVFDDIIHQLDKLEAEQQEPEASRPAPYVLSARISDQPLWVVVRHLVSQIGTPIHAPDKHEFDSQSEARIARVRRGLLRVGRSIELDCLFQECILQSQDKQLERDDLETMISTLHQALIADARGISLLTVGTSVLCQKAVELDFPVAEKMLACLQPCVIKSNWESAFISSADKAIYRIVELCATVDMCSIIALLKPLYVTSGRTDEFVTMSLFAADRFIKLHQPVSAATICTTINQVSAAVDRSEEVLMTAKRILIEDASHGTGLATCMIPRLFQGPEMDSQRRKIFAVATMQTISSLSRRDEHRYMDSCLASLQPFCTTPQLQDECIMFAIEMIDAAVLKCYIPCMVPFIRAFRPILKESECKHAVVQCGFRAITSAMQQDGVQDAHTLFDTLISVDAMADYHEQSVAIGLDIVHALAVKGISFELHRIYEFLSRADHLRDKLAELCQLRLVTARAQRRSRKQGSMAIT